MARKVSRAKRAAAGFLVLQSWMMMDSLRVMTWSRVSKDLRDGLTERELQELQRTSELLKRVNERHRIIGRHLNGG
jgi:hypothetical protein